MNGVFANEVNATAIIIAGKHIQAMNRRGVAALKQQLFNVIDEYQRVNWKIEQRTTKAYQLRQVLNLPISDNVPTIILKMYPLILMDQAGRGHFTQYSSKSLYVMIYELLNTLNVFKRNHSHETPANDLPA